MCKLQQQISVVYDDIFCGLKITTYHTDIMVLHLMRMKEELTNNITKYRIGVDLGGTKTEAVLFDYTTQTVLRRIRKKTPSQHYDKIIDTIASLIFKVSSCLPNGLSDVQKIGVCTPGTEYGKDNLITNSNTASLQDRPLRHDIQTATHRQDILLENDANCFALAESVMGAGVQFNHVFGVIMGTGVGGGIIFDKKIHRGRDGVAGEWGHHTLHVNGNPCYCKRYGCVETYLSGPALEQRWQKLTGTILGMPQIIDKISHIITLESKDNEKYHTWRNEALDNFGRAIANVISILNPDVIILGGGLSNIKMWYGPGAKAVRRHMFSHLTRDTPILQNKLGDSAGVIGACLL